LREDRSFNALFSGLPGIIRSSISYSPNVLVRTDIYFVEIKWAAMSYEPSPSEVTQFETATLTPYFVARVVTSLLDGLKCARR